MSDHDDPIRKIDWVLTFFATSKAGEKYMPYKMLLDLLHIPTNELTMILNKLIKDDYVARETITNARSLETSVGYRITFEGLLFNQQGGYEQEMSRRNAESTRVKQLETSQQTLMAKLNTLTAWVAGGTIGLVMIELIKLLNDHFHWWH